MWPLLLSCRPEPAAAPPAACTPDPAAKVESLEVSSPHERASDREVDLVLGAEAPAALLCSADDDPSDRILLESPAAESHAFHLQGLRYGATYQCHAGPICPAGVDATGSVEIQIGADIVPDVAISGDPGEGWLLTGIRGNGGCGDGLDIVILDAQGRLRWELWLPGAGIDNEVLPYGASQLLIGGATGQLQGPIAVDLWDGQVWSANLPGNEPFSHDGKALPDGRVLALSDAVDELGGQKWLGFQVRAVHPESGVVDFDWRSQALVDDGTFPAGVDDAYHANWVDLVDSPAGEKLYVSSCRRWEIWRVDVATGRLDWRLGDGGDFALVDANGAPLPADQFPQCQHGLEVAADGSLLVYDNGVGRGVSRVMELGIDEDARVATRRWEWTDGWFEFTMGDVDWLPNGHVLVTKAHAECWSTSDAPATVLEVDPATGDVAWSLAFTDRDLAIYRAEWVDGCKWFGNVGQCAALVPRWDELAPRLGAIP